MKDYIIKKLLLLIPTVLAITFLGLSLVVGGNYVWVSHVGFGPELLTRTAWATSGSVVVVCALAGFAVRRVTGSGIGILTGARVALAVLGCYVIGRAFPTLPRLGTIGIAVLLAGVYFSVLCVTRELGAKDLAQLRALFGRATPRA